MTNPWRGDLVTAWWSSVFPDVDVYTVYPVLLRWLLRSPLASPLRALLGARSGQALLQAVIARLPAGPSERQLALGLTRIWAQAEDPSGQRVTARMRGPQAYLFTARTALWVAQRVLAGRLRVGFQTPVTAYGPDLVDRLVEDLEGIEVSWG
ncbi:MAG: hypothetical protein JOZ15_20120 [Acidobacteria bacterium]|nr:hypothetical protein [Acidobacteriota bacterium]